MDNQKKSLLKYAFCYSSYLYNNFQNFKEGTLIVDTRDNESYSKHHIKGSINLSNQRIKDFLQQKPNYSEETKITLQDLNQILGTEESKKFAKRRRCFCFLKITQNSLTRTFLNELKRLINLDDHEDSFQVPEANVQELLQRTLEENEEKDSMVMGLEIFKLLQKDKVRELFILVDGSSNFFSKYPYMANLVSSGPDPVGIYHHSVNSLLEYDFPHDILDGRLFLGSYNQSEKHCLVTNLKITHIINITHECENVHEDKGIKYLKLPILDEPDKDIHLHFKKAFDFIDEAWAEDSHHNILVHCAMGKSRSATIVIMYLMKRFSWNYDKAFGFVKRKREIIDPNEGFVQQLQEFERNNYAFVVGGL